VKEKAKGALQVVVILGVIVGALFVVAWQWSGFRHWLDKWSALAEWLVAAGTLGLAAATYVLARRARDEAEAVRSESDRLGEQARAALRAYVYVETSAGWAQGIDAPEMRWSAYRLQFLPLRNGGPGVALDVRGTLVEPISGTTIPIYAGGVPPGQSLITRPRSAVSSWEGVLGELRYGDLNGDEWVTRFRFALGEGNQLYAEHDPPEQLLDVTGER
jgi:DNA-binding transcriptional regulator of glucitol operon